MFHSVSLTNWSRIVMVTPATLYQRLPSMPQRSRRLAVVAAFTGYPLLIVGYHTLVAAGIIPSAIWAPIAIVLFAATLLGLVAVYGYGQGRVNERDRLDERQRTMVDRALVTSYGALTTLIVLIAGLLAIYLSFVGPVTLDMGVLTPWFIAIGLYVPSLPFAALAWIEADAPADDDDR
jgi:hypothetical protein